MNSIFVLAFCLTAVLAAPQLNDPNHYAQHNHVVQLARASKSGKLENFGSSNTQQVVPNDDYCGLCASQSAGSELSQTSAKGYGIVVPSGGSELTSSSVDYSSSTNEASAQPIHIPVGGESSSRFQSSSSQTENVGINPVVVPFSGGSENYIHQSDSSSSSSLPVVHHVTYSQPSGSESYSQHSEQISESSSPVVQQIVYSPSSGSESYSHHSKQISESSAPVAPQIVYSPSGGSESYSHHSKQVIQSAPTPIVPIFAPSSGSESHSHFFEKNVQSNAAQQIPVYTPSANEHFTQSQISESRSSVPVVAPIITYSPSSGSSFESYRRQQIQQQSPSVVPIYSSPITGGSRHFASHNSKITQQAAPAVIVPTYGGGGHSVHSESRFDEIKATPVVPIVYPVLPSVGSHSSSFRESHSSNQAAPQYVYHSAPTSQFSNKYTASSGNYGGNVGALAYSPSFGSSSSHISEDSSSSSGNFGSTVGVVGYPSGSQISQIGSRFGSSSGVSSNLGQYMSESERLARLQTQNIQSSSGYKGSSVADFGVAQTSVPASTGSHTKSWEKSSKWASQSEYDQTGTTKSNGFLTTAEGEDETINGRSAGYRAATTTIDNDGNKSTYSVHSK